MIRVIIVDDEELIREHLKKIIDWNSCGFEIIGAAADGEEAMELIDRLAPDLVITDIRMPFMDGLQLISAASKKYKDLSFVILSIYDEFSYAKKALDLGAFSYILKPIIKDELLEMLEKFRSDFDEKKKKAEEAELQLNNRRSLMRERLFAAYMFDDKGDQIDDDLFPLVNIRREDYFCVLSVEMDDVKMLSSILEKGEYLAICEKFKNYIYTNLTHFENIAMLQTDSCCINLCLWGGEEQNIEMNVSRLVSALRVKSANNRFTFTAGIGSVIKGVERIQRSFLEAKEALNDKYAFGKNKDFLYSAKDDIKRQSINFDDRTFLENLRKADCQSIMLQIDCFGESLFSVPSCGEIFNSVLYRIVAHIITVLDEYSPLTKKHFDTDFERILYETTLMETLNEKIISVKKLAGTACEEIRKVRHQGKNNIIAKLIPYINENYQRADLSLKEAARYTATNATYLSELFKQEVGQTFTQYLTELRIRKAKELMLHSSLKIYEISDMVGYNNPTYFSSIFKRTTGMTPSDFCQKE